LLIKTATDLRLARASELTLGFGAAVANAILSSPLAILPALERLPCFTKIYDIAHALASTAIIRV